MPPLPPRTPGPRVKSSLTDTELDDPFDVAAPPQIASIPAAADEFSLDGDDMIGESEDLEPLASPEPPNADALGLTEAKADEDFDIDSAFGDDPAPSESFPLSESDLTPVSTVANYVTPAPIARPAAPAPPRPPPPMPARKPSPPPPQPVEADEPPSQRITVEPAIPYQQIVVKSGEPHPHHEPKNEPKSGPPSAKGDAIVAIPNAPDKPEPVSSKPDARVVLVVEDDDSIRSMIVKTLAMTYTVYQAADGQFAAEALARMSPHPDVIVSDVMMPRLDGIALARKIKASPQLKSIPIIFLTAKNTTLEVVDGINAGARFYLTKPFKVKELLEKVAVVLKRS